MASSASNVASPPATQAVAASERVASPKKNVRRRLVILIRNSVPLSGVGYRVYLVRSKSVWMVVFGSVRRCPLVRLFPQAGRSCGHDCPTALENVVTVDRSRWDRSGGLVGFWGQIRGADGSKSPQEVAARIDQTTHYTML